MNRPRRLAALAILLGSAISAPASAETLAPIEVTSSLDNLAARASEEDATTPVRVVERSSFENRISSLADVVGEQAGMQVRQGGGLGSFSTVSLRGSSSQQVQVFIDGMLLNDPVSGSVDLGRFSLHDMARVRIYPSSPPAQFAHASIGGVVAMETLGAEAEDTTRAYLGAGSFDTRRTGLFHARTHDRFNYWLSLNDQRSDNDFSYSNESRWFNPNDGSTTTRRNAQFEQQDVSAKAGYRIDDARRVDALFQLSEREQGIPTIQNWRNNDASLDSDSRRLQFHYQDTAWLDGSVHSSHRLLWSDVSETFDDRSGRVGLGRQHVVTETRRVSALNSVSVLLGGHTLTGSVDVSDHDYDQDDHLDSDPADQRERLMVTTALGHEWFSLDDRWQTQAVVRRFSVRDRSDETAADNSTESASEREAYSAWQVGARRALGSRWKVSANVARQVRIPTLRERFGQQGLFIGNADLEAEEARNLDATLATEQPWGHLEVTGFRRHLEPAIVATFDARGVGRYTNTEARLEGVEGTAGYRPLASWHLTANATLQDSENVSPDISDRDGKRLPGIYHRSAMLRSTWMLDPYELGLSYHYDDELFYDSANNLEADARRTLNASLSWRRRWSERRETQVQLEVRNITDELYQDFNRFPGPGRAWFLTLEHSFF